VDLAVPGTLVLTETNVPHQENISYFGDGDEAHMVYNFSLPPLLLDAMESGDTSVLIDWLGKLKPPTPQTTFFNFTASHDGIGVRPLEGIVNEERLAAVVSRVRRHGGEVSMRSKGDGTESPYELNITYIDAVADPQLPAAERTRRFMTTQAFMLAMQGMPAVYFQSLIGGPSDHAGMEESNQKRRINRRKFERQELEDLLADGDSSMGMVFEQYQRILGIRRRLPAMHPNASQRVLQDVPEGGVGWIRGESLGADRAVSVLCNLSEQPIEYPSKGLPIAELDYLSGETFSSDAMIHLAPFQMRWIGAAAILEEH
jgi:sucrose phosphorylase